ncbi:MAG: hypothetical protein M1134_05140 [Actinobacteria bacterium]|jgi:hypothetical protein|nr:hypothetical protein [Actinomycetota bacterium]MCL5445235.1 hypothetical protein [Actinomycetota bacterium]MDA8400477.1 hypothetical protein [Actinomycetota bacterium]
MSPARPAGGRQDEVVELVRQAEEAVLTAGRRIAGATADAVPMLPSEVKKVVDEAFDTTAKVLEMQRDLVKSLLSAVLGPDRKEEGEPTSKP